MHWWEVRLGNAKNFFKYKFIHLFTLGCAGSLSLLGLALILASRGCFLAQGTGFSSW